MARDGMPRYVHTALGMIPVWTQPTDLLIFPYAFWNSICLSFVAAVICRLSAVSCLASNMPPLFQERKISRIQAFSIFVSDSSNYLLPTYGYEFCAVLKGSEFFSSVTPEGSHSDSPSILITFDLFLPSSRRYAKPCPRLSRGKLHFMEARSSLVRTVAWKNLSRNFAVRSVTWLFATSPTLKIKENYASETY